jgi:hypothetical protein
MPKNKKGRRKSRHRRSHHTLTNNSTRSTSLTTATDHAGDTTDHGDTAPQPSQGTAVAALLPLGCAIGIEPSSSVDKKKRILETTLESATMTTTTTTTTTNQQKTQRRQRKRSRPTVTATKSSTTATSGSSSSSSSSKTCLDGKRDDHGMYGDHGKLSMTVLITRYFQREFPPLLLCVCDSMVVVDVLHVSKPNKLVVSYYHNGSSTFVALLGQYTC